MHEYDIALKTFLRGGRESLLELAGIAVERWHNVEMSQVRGSRLDLLGQSADGRLLHIELQSTNDPLMALRMMEYCAAIYRQFRRLPEQIVLYVGEAPLRMKGVIQGPDVSFTCRMVDIRELDGERLLESDSVGDNIIAVLTEVRHRRGAIGQILGRIAEGDPQERASRLAGLVMLGGLRRLEDTIEREANGMPLLDDIMDNRVLGREFRRGERALLARQIEKRFGSVPEHIPKLLDSLSESELQAAALRLFDASSLEDLFAGH